jgi:hypothetical protein
MRTIGLALLLLAGCGREAELVGDNKGVTLNQIEQLSTPEEEVLVDPNLSARPAPLRQSDVTAAGLAEPACRFGRDGRLLFAASGGDAIARVGGQLLHFTHSSPMGPTGGFFEDRNLSVSIGRTGGNVGGERVGVWPAHLTVTDRRNRAQVELQGAWRCGA